ncbi:unnamed protein product [Thlaspi arvense]|uniref:EamA domain-containing protein n=1 Tax=Thlaspi arvense TaxID=13288 RepID=A0AAU9TD99_THLAR|nr:unnamed protein product [Thlaspi arvense]
MERVSENLDIKTIMRGSEEETVAWRYFGRDVVPFAAMFLVECTNVGSNTLYKAASLRGLSFYVFLFYSYVVATLLLLPLSFIFGRSKRLPSAKFPLFFKIFILGLLGFMAQIAGCKGIEYSSPTLSSAISNLTPAFTFMLAVIFRMEKVVLRSSATQAKIIGAIVSISGALVVVLYKGPKVLAAASSPSTISLHQSVTSFESSWIIGGLLLASGYFLSSVWYILQTRVMEVYPEEITVVLFYNLFAMLISGPVCFFAESNLSSWAPKPGISLASIIYTGVFVSLVSALTHTWGLRLKGPVYISLFRPLSIAIAVAMGAIFLGDALHLGSVIGSLILCFGFYTVIWGKAKEANVVGLTIIIAYELTLTSEKFFESLDMARGAEEETVAWRYFCRDVAPFAAMIAVECLTVGSNTLFKAATLRGLSFYVFVFYSYVVATLVLLPLSLIFGRSRRLPSVKSPVFFKIFLLALVGFMSGMAGCKGMEYSSPTLSSAISNLTPAFTFTLAVIFRMEQVVLKSSATQAKIIGTIVSISGALVVVLYKGPKVIAAASSSSTVSHLTSFDSSWMIGGLLLVSQYMLISVWYILQTQVMSVYPEEITVVFLYNLCATLISAPVCLYAEKDLSSFLLKPGVSLAAILYSVKKITFSEVPDGWLSHSLSQSSPESLYIRSMTRGTGEETVAWRHFCRDVVPFTAMVAAECVTVGSNTLFKAATLRGLSFYVFVFYNYVIATLVLLPLTLIFGRSRRLPLAKSPVFFKIFLLALVGFMSVIAGCKGIEYSSPTLASAISNLTPAFTFTLAVIFGMEKVVLRSSTTQAKIIGTIVSISGALVVVLYKGPKVLASSSLTISLEQHLSLSESSWIIGGILIASQYLLVSIWLILQTRIMEVYPEEISVVFLYNLCAALISAPVCLFAEKDLTSFLLKPDISLASVMYSGALVSSLGSVIHTWGLHLKGPVYISLFKPLSIVIAVIMGALFLGDPLHLGSVIGSVILSLGFYTVIWGKAREDATKTVAGSEQSPLLVTYTREDEASSLRCD